MRIESFIISQNFSPPNSGIKKVRLFLNSADGHTENGPQTEDLKLKNRDQEVRRHEQAHLAAARGLETGGANFAYQTGPDGKRYAVGGEVNIDTPLYQVTPMPLYVKHKTFVVLPWLLPTHLLRIKL